MGEPKSLRDLMATGGELPADARDVMNEILRTHDGVERKLGISFEEISRDRLVATMPVTGNTQPYGLLHGGATMALAEGLASTGAAIRAAAEGKIVMGLQQACNFLSTLTEGNIRAVATPVHVGRTTQVWDVDITAIETGKRVAAARVTLAVREPRA